MLNPFVTRCSRLGQLFVLALTAVIGACGYQSEAPPLLKAFPVPADAQHVQRNDARGITGRAEESLGFAVRRLPGDMEVPLALERVSRDQGWMECRDKLPTGWRQFIDRSSEGKEQEKLQFRRLYKKGDWLAELLIEQPASEKKSQQNPSVQLVHLRISNRDANNCT